MITDRIGLHSVLLPLLITDQRDNIGLDCTKLNIENRPITCLSSFTKCFSSFVSTWKVAGKDENNKDVSYFINVCGNVDDDSAPKDCKNKENVQLCFRNTPLHVQSKTFYYEGMVHLNTSAVENYSKTLYR